MPKENDARNGSVSTTTLVLAVLKSGPLHGYGIAREIERRSRSLLRPGESALYPALRALEQDGYITGGWQIMQDGPPRKVYQLTWSGEQEITRRTGAWSEYKAAINLVMQCPASETAL